MFSVNCIQLNYVHFCLQARVQLYLPFNMLIKLQSEVCEGAA